MTASASANTGLGVRNDPVPTAAGSLSLRSEGATIPRASQALAARGVAASEPRNPGEPSIPRVPRYASEPRDPGVPRIPGNPSVGGGA